ncbi:3-hydroxyacyl-CoA dehydrogenase NAD-binding domain-containing protein [Pendulispora albinea]|uniref:3-hydroxyacyl-CoA dehydrogenase NAD-binding domain-containing protein n=1 Tax=Pendulispora albinea TaxID=2741071 RepID=A0ABZ2M7V6_9BACT
MPATHYERRGTVAVITLDNPPVNGLGHAVRLGICEGLERAEADPEVSAVVLTGAGKAFSGGADITEFKSGKQLAEPMLRSVIRALEASTKPVIAAIHAVAMGGGLELALGAHFRVAAAGAKIALPEVKLGLLPGAGGTQRLPRAIGLEAALNMIASGEPVLSEKLAGTALFDRLIDGDLVTGAVAFAEEIVREKRPLKKLRDAAVEHPNPEGFVQFARNTVAAMAKNFPAPLGCVDAVAASTEPFEVGLRKEGELFQRLMATPESRALRHLFFAERAASKIADVPPETKGRPIQRVAIVGAGTMGGGIAMCFANAGIPVTVLEAKEEALGKGLGVIRKNYESTVKKGKLPADKAEERIARIQGTLAYEDLANADLVIEAVFEDLAVKQGVFTKLDAVMKPGAILASNTSTLDLDKIAAFTKRPADIVGMHFFSPAHVMKLLEVVRGKATGKDVLATVMDVAKKIGKTAVVSGVCDGFIGNRMIERYGLQAALLLEEGALPAQVDRALERWGMAMGPFRMNDLAGNDIGWAIRKRRYVEYPEIVYSKIGDRICELGRFGQKTGKGWYRYEPGQRDAIPDPAVDELVIAYSNEIGAARRAISDEEIVARCIFALVNEGAQIVEEGIAQRASDIDVVYVSGYGFPLYRGGPMLYADEQGLPNVLSAMRRFGRTARGDRSFWEPAPLLARLAAEGRTFHG